MAARIDFRASDGSAIIPVAEDSFTPLMSADYAEGELAVLQFFSDAAGETLVTPSSGTVKMTGTPDGTHYFTVQNGEFDASTVYTETRPKPYGQGEMIKAKLDMTSIVGAAYYSAHIWRR